MSSKENLAKYLLPAGHGLNYSHQKAAQKRESQALTLRDETILRFRGMENS